MIQETVITFILLQKWVYKYDKYMAFKLLLDDLWNHIFLLYSKLNSSHQIYIS